MIFPQTYKSILNVHETERAIKSVKDHFQTCLSTSLNLYSVTAPMFVKSGTGIQDDLSGAEKSVSFIVKHDGARVEVVHSLAKWKRMALKDYGYTEAGEGLICDMNAIRCDESELDNIHSIYVDQWDWELVLSKKQRSLDTLKAIVRKIYFAILSTQKFAHREVDHRLPVTLPEEITFVHSEDLQAEFPDLDDKGREHAITKRHGAVFIIGIGAPLADGKPHDGRSPDYDDFTTPTVDGKRGLNGDILVWSDVLDRSVEMTSMGIRVDEETLLRQLKDAGKEERASLEWHQRLLNGEFPCTIGGGIGQSRVCQFILQKAHVGEVQSSYWPADMRKKCAENNIFLL